MGPAQVLAFAANTCAILGILDFLLESHTSYTHIALQTAVALFVLSFGVACARTDSGLGALLTSASYGGMLTRWLWPAAIIVPLVIGSVSWLAFSAGFLSEWGGITTMIVAMITLLAGSTVWTPNASIAATPSAGRRKGRCIDGKKSCGRPSGSHAWAAGGGIPPPTPWPGPEGPPYRRPRPEDSTSGFQGARVVLHARQFRAAHRRGRTGNRHR